MPKEYIKDIPILSEEYDFKNNEGIEFEKLTCGMRMEVNWVCSKNHRWKSQIRDRNKQLKKGNLKSSCPYCAGKKVCKDNCLATTHPHLLKEWSKKNEIKPTEVVAGTRKSALWKCEKCQEEWKTVIATRTLKKCGCPYCSGVKIGKKNSLAYKFPDLVNDWNWSKNINIDPDKIVAGSATKAWWKCSKGHEWKVQICSRTGNKTGCPYCSGHKACKDNCLATTHPKIAREWSKKNKIKSIEVVAGSNKKVWWKCRKCNYNWATSVCQRALKCHGCPKCNESKGEKLVSQALGQIKTRYKREYKFKELGNYRFDFALFKKYARKPWLVIEYHGIQHYEPIKFSYKMSVKKANEKFNYIKNNDKIKKKYCIDNDIKYLEIPYTKKDDVEQLIREFIK